MANKDNRLIKTGRKRNNWKDFFRAVMSALVLTLIFAYTGSTMYYLGSLEERINIPVSRLLAGDKNCTPYVEPEQNTNQSGGGNSSNTNIGNKSGDNDGDKDKAHEIKYINKIIKLAGFDKHSAPYNLEKVEQDNDDSSDKRDNTKKITYKITPWYVSLIRVIKYTLLYSRSTYTSILSFVPGKNEKNAIPILILLPFVLLFYLFLGIPAIGLVSFILGPALGFSSFSIPGMIFALFALFFGPAAITALFSGLYQGFFIVFITFILPILSNFRELLNIVSNNYCLYTSLFGLLVVSSSFKFLKTEASLVMLVTYIYLLWKTCLKS
jgi:hypothetical protein